ncbi:hypothetical protein GYMLUDRAFT_244208 [Collybiopsis luxurians FD-317 M1]|uniref:Uncharacterized protein n=1 Tax=Collybiopsis luxurians FD-317 M1 TaxID=944289 RepID=A0A0D0CP71_9AGAR|nr:hypothetical protein GYMLUDRAFT_244208 [Collybiopsis luxurians FD-317 M1]
MSSSQLFPDQPVASSSNSGGLRPQLIIKVLQPLQLASLIPFSNALPSVPPVAKKMQYVAFECSMHLQYPSIPVSDSILSSLPTNIQPIYKDTYLANSSPKALEKIAANEWKKSFGHYPSCKYCASHNLHSTCSLHPNSLSCATCKCDHPEELGLALDRPRAQEGKRKAVVSSNAFQKSQLLWQERLHLGELSCEQVVLAPSCKGKEVVCDPVDVDVEMEALEELDAMNLDYPEEVPPPPTPISTVPAPIWKAVDTQSYSKVSSLKMWFFKPLVKQVPSDGSSLTCDEMIQTAIKHVVMRIALLFAGSGKKMLEQDLWAMVDGLIQGAFTGLEEQLQHSPSKPPASFLSKSLLQFIKSLSVVNMTSVNIINSQQDELL